MCIYFEPNVPKQCLEDDAEEVSDKEKVNFCEWFKPSATAFDPARAAQETRAKNELASLFDDGSAERSGADPATEDAENLFK